MTAPSFSRHGWWPLCIFPRHLLNIVTTWRILPLTMSLSGRSEPFGRVSAAWMGRKALCSILQRNPATSFWPAVCFITSPWNTGWTCGLRRPQDTWNNRKKSTSKWNQWTRKPVAFVRSFYLLILANVVTERRPLTVHLGRYTEQIRPFVFFKSVVTKQMWDKEKFCSLRFRWYSELLSISPEMQFNC